MSPARGFETAEFQARVARAQREMAREGLDALLLTTEPELRYYSGFLTRFWESPTRVWFLVVPQSGAPIAVIPEIGAHLMGQGWIRDIRTWAAPDYADDGTALLAQALSEVVPKAGRIGVATAMESHLRLPLAAFEALKAALAPCVITSDAGITRRLRMVKSPAERAKIEAVCTMATRAFDRVPEIARQGVALSEVFRDFQRLLLEEGADYVPYVAGASEAGGYGDVISPASDRPLRSGDVLMLDTGAVHDGYFCDFDRNYSLGPPEPAVAYAHARLIEATAAGFEAARPGAMMCDLYDAMAAVLGAATGAGRLGHGLGMQLTEWPSIIPADRTELVAGMVLTLEPGITLGRGKMLVHEENIVIEADGARFLSRPQGAEMRVL